MITKDFYKLLDKELDIILDKYKDDSFLKKHKKNSHNQKSYALLIWFLEFYAKLTNYTQYITDGENDSSCDIIFDKKDNFGNNIFYIVQSKWNNEDNVEKETSKDEILKTLQEFEILLRGEKRNINEKLKSKLEQFYEHLKNNGEVKFIFLSLANYEGKADENIISFQNKHEKTKFEIIDINRIKLDFIDRRYKKIDPINPLENYQNPEELKIILEVEKNINKNANFIKIERPFEAYVFLLRPKIIYELFDKYGFFLFHKNVRNPLLQSQFNHDIEKTAIENPSYFWYYNNGLTAIASYLPTIRNQAQKVEVSGLQIINGAQTVYSIYKAYKEASIIKREQMDSEILLTLRLMKSGGKDFDLKVTRFTNSQNPVEERDFYANDEIQIELQKSSFKTKYWYEKRKDEFREVPEGIKVIPNYILTNPYLAFHLQDYLTADKNQDDSENNLDFISYKDNKDGSYEKIFNKNTKFEDMLTSFLIYREADLNIIEEYNDFNLSVFLGINSFLTMYNIIISKYLYAKFSEKINVNKYILDLIERNDLTLIKKIPYYLDIYFQKYYNINKYNLNLSNIEEKTKLALQDTKILPEDIDNIEI
ncbi:MAG: AIPR family protein [Candidatus Sericytochromatia bacterium]